MAFDYHIPDKNSPQCSDERLLQLMAEGDKEAFAILYKRHWEDLFITAARALRGKNEAADVVQDVFLSIWKRKNELNLQGSLSAYLHTSVRYKCIHYIEKNITQRDYLARLAEMSVTASAPNAEMNLQVQETLRSINKAVAKMPPKMQEVYMLSRQECLSYKEIADLLGISVETVKKHIQHALQLIRQDMAPNIILFMIMVLSVLS